MLQKELHTERLHLIPFSKSHLEHHLELFSIPDTVHYTGGLRSREDNKREFSEAIAGAVRGLGYWAGFVGDEFVGCWILRVPEFQDSGETPVHEDSGELGYYLFPRYWRRGLGSEGARELLRYGFEDLGLAQVVAFTSANNAASRATMVSIGMHFVREFEANPADFPEGSDLHGVEYAISAEGWKLR